MPAGAGGRPATAETRHNAEVRHHHSTARQEVADVARSLPSDELAALADALRAEVAYWQTLEDLDEDSREVALHLASERLAACEAELARREALARAGVCRSPSAEGDYAAWRALAAEVRRRVDVRDLLAREAGWRPVRQSAREAAGPCPLCGGHDRLVAWPDRAWCRRCGWSGDAVAIARLVWGCGFREGIERLAEVAR